jgi:hypothetical protein
MTIPWMAISSLALDAIGAASSAKAAATNVANKRVVDAANTAAANLVRAANNELASKKGSLDRYNQSVNNQRVMESTGSAIEAATMNYRRARDSALQDDFEQQIKFAEQAGSQAAAAAFSGIQGGVVDVINSTSALRKSRIQQRMDTSLKQGDYDARVRIGNIALQGWDSLDSSVIADNIDHNVNVAQSYQDAPGFWTHFAGKVDLKNVASVTDYVGKTFGGKEKFQWEAPASYNYGVE